MVRDVLCVSTFSFLNASMLDLFTRILSIPPTSSSGPPHLVLIPNQCVMLWSNWHECKGLMCRLNSI